MLRSQPTSGFCPCDPPTDTHRRLLDVIWGRIVGPQWRLLPCAYMCVTYLTHAIAREGGLSSARHPQSGCNSLLGFVPLYENPWRPRRERALARRLALHGLWAVRSAIRLLVRLPHRIRCYLDGVEKGRRDFGELRQCEIQLRRRTLPRTTFNKGYAARSGARRLFITPTALWYLSQGERR